MDLQQLQHKADVCGCWRCKGKHEQAINNVLQPLTFADAFQLHVHNRVYDINGEQGVFSCGIEGCGSPTCTHHKCPVEARVKNHKHEEGLDG